MSTNYIDDKQVIDAVEPAGWGYRLLNDGRELYELGFGSWQIGDRSDTTVQDQVNLALELGYVHFDTAQVSLNGVRRVRLARGADPTPADLPQRGGSWSCDQGVRWTQAVDHYKVVRS